MTKASQIKKRRTLACDAGWRNYHFVKIMTEDGIVGWSEYDEGFGAPGVTAAIERLAARVVGKNAFQHERIYAELFAATRPAAGGVVALALGAIENALLDVKAKALGVPCYELLGGKIRDRIRVYWSHCADLAHQSPRLVQAGDYRSRWRQIDRARGAGKRLYGDEDQHLRLHRRQAAGLAAGLRLAVRARDQCRPQGAAKPLHASGSDPRCAGPDVDLLLDLNFNAKTEGYLKILRAIKDMDLFWVEIDTFNPQALGYIRRQSPHPVSSCETLLGLREFLPYFNEQAMDVAIIDTPWNGVWQSMKIAAAAEHFEVNVAPHNFYGHLCTMMNAHSPPPCRTCASWKPTSTGWRGTMNCSRMCLTLSTATSSCRIAPAGAPSPTRKAAP